MVGVRVGCVFWLPGRASLHPTEVGGVCPLLPGIPVGECGLGSDILSWGPRGGLGPVVGNCSLRWGPSRAVLFRQMLEMFRCYGLNFFF